jgi:pyridoxine kinase
MAKILSISSQVARGHVGNSAVSFALMRRGLEVVPVPTILLAHHFGHARTVARVDIPDLQAMGQDVLGSPRRYPVDGILIGYVALAPQAAAIAGIVADARADRRDIPVLLDPVAGDSGRLYIDESILDEIATQLLPAADIATPNVTELVALTDRTRIEAAPHLLEADIVARARALGPPIVVVTSGPASAEGRIANLVVTGEMAVRVETPRVEVHVHGTGDLLAGLILGEIVAGADVIPAVATAAAIVHDVLAATAAGKGDELALVAAQKILVEPKTSAEVSML